MSKLRVIDVQEITARAEEALSKASACSVKLDEVQVLSGDNRRNFIARAAAGYPDTQRFRRYCGSILGLFPQAWPERRATVANAGY
jgi:hypothetical protein